MPLPIPIDIAETIQAYSCSLYRTRPPNTIMTIPSVLLFIDNFITYNKVQLTISHGKKTPHLHAGLYKGVTK